MMRRGMRQDSIKIFLMMDYGHHYYTTTRYQPQLLQLQYLGFVDLVVKRQRYSIKLTHKVPPPTIAQWEFGRPQIDLLNIEHKSEVQGWAYAINISHFFSVLLKSLDNRKIISFVRDQFHDLDGQSTIIIKCCNHCPCHCNF